MASKASDLMYPGFALILTIVATICIFIVTFHTIRVTSYGPLSSGTRVLWATVSTIIASVITLFVTTQIRLLWIRRINIEFDKAQGPGSLSILNSKWRTILGVQDMKEGFNNFKIQFTYLCAGLITTALVASFTPTMTSRVINDYTVISSGGGAYPEQESCINVYPATAQPSFGTHYWNLSSGERLWVTAPGGSCPTRRAVALMTGINDVTPEEYAYTDFGVSIHSTAIGAPVSVYASPNGFGQNLAELINHFESSVISTTQCVPVMTHNPITCRTGGTLDVGLSSLTARSADGRCQVRSSFVNHNPLTSNTMTKGLCTYGEPGQATIVLAATNAYAGWLALDIGDIQEFNESRPGYPRQQVVTCTVDTRNVYSFRNVALGIQTRSNVTFGWQMNATEAECEMDPAYGTDMTGLYAATATANWQPLFENEGIDGWFDSINRHSFIGAGVAGVLPIKREKFAFWNSRNGLEDTLGLTAATVGAYMNSSQIGLTGQAVIATTRIGPGHAWGVVYTVPLLASAMILMVLLVRTVSEVDVPRSTIQIGDLVGMEADSRDERL